MISIYTIHSRHSHIKKYSEIKSVHVKQNQHARTVGNESVQLVQCWLPWLAISDAKI